MYEITNDICKKHKKRLKLHRINVIILSLRIFFNLLKFSIVSINAEENDFCIANCRAEKIFSQATMACIFGFKYF